MNNYIMFLLKSFKGFKKNIKNIINNRINTEKESNETEWENILLSEIKNVAKCSVEKYFKKGIRNYLKNKEKLRKIIEFTFSNDIKTYFKIIL